MINNQSATNTTTSKSPLKNLWRHLLLAIVLFMMSLVVGLHTSPELASGALEELIQTIKPILQTLGFLGPLALLFLIFLNNAVKALAAIALGILLGIPPLIFVAANGFMLGVAISALKSTAGYGLIVAGLAPHGIIEIPLLLLASALGLRIGWQSLRYLIGQKSSMRAQLRNGIRIYLKWILAGLFIAALIEVFITPIFILLAGGKELFMK